MLNRKESKLSNGAEGHGRNGRPSPAAKGRPRRRFIISARAAGRAEAPRPEPRNGASKPHSAAQAKSTSEPQARALPPGSAASPVDLGETIKTLLHLAHENGHVTYDD